jgi:hypothetical protein
MTFLENLLYRGRPHSIGLKANRIQKLRKQFLNPFCRHRLSLLESQELDLLDKHRFVGLFLTDSDPVLILGVAFPRAGGPTRTECGH